LAQQKGAYGISWIKEGEKACTLDISHQKILMKIKREELPMMV
jgi:hypothetical protein